MWQVATSDVVKMYSNVMSGSLSPSANSFLASLAIFERQNAEPKSPAATGMLIALQNGVKRSCLENHEPFCRWILQPRDSFAELMCYDCYDSHTLHV